MQCSRSGCSKQLRVDNTKGVCSSNCESADAPLGAQAAGVKRAPSTTSAKKVETSSILKELETQEKNEAHAVVLAKFRTVAEALGFDPDEELAKAAQGWLEAAGAAVKAADDETE
jgi:hypothetical protein